MSTSLLTILLGIVSLASALGAAFALFRASYAKVSNETLRENNADLVARVSILEAEIIRLGVYEKENQLLRGLIPSEDVLRSMIAQHESWATQLSEEHQMMSQLLHSLMDHLDVRRPSSRSQRAPK